MSADERHRGHPPPDPCRAAPAGVGQIEGAAVLGQPARQVGRLSTLLPPSRAAGSGSRSQDTSLAQASSPSVVVTGAARWRGRFAGALPDAFTSMAGPMAIATAPSSGSRIVASSR